MMTRIGGYLIGLGIFSTVDAERRSELLSQYTVADARWHAQLKHVEQARSTRLRWEQLSPADCDALISFLRML